MVSKGEIGCWSLILPLPALHLYKLLFSDPCVEPELQTQSTKASALLRCFAWPQERKKDVGRGSSSLPLQEGFPESPGTQQHLSLPEGRGKPYVKPQKCFPALPKPLEQFPGEAQQQQLLHPSQPLSSPAASPGCMEAAVGAGLSLGSTN